MKKKLQVFVSSTFEDLKEERQAAVSTILESGHIPAGMELFSATDQTQKEVIKKWIDESDVYMLILGGRYGSIDPDSGTSYTEWEYNYATETEKPLFAVVINDDALDAKVAKDGRSMIEQINPQLLTEFRITVLSNMSSFFSDYKDIKLAIWQSITELNGRENLVGWVSGAEVPDDQKLIIENAKLEGKIDELTTENMSLKIRLEEQVKEASLVIGKSFDFKGLSKVLKSKPLRYQPKENEEYGASSNALDIFIKLKNRWVVGITSSGNSGYYFHNVCPTLKLYGLLELNPIDSVNRRRFELTDKGADLLMYMDSEALNKTDAFVEKTAPEQ
jgi:nucleoside 2-deoxyribosyltransferase